MGSLKGRSLDIFCFHYIWGHLFNSSSCTSYIAMPMTQDLTSWLNLKTPISLPSFMTVEPELLMVLLRKTVTTLTPSLATALDCPCICWYVQYVYLYFMYVFLSSIWATLKLSFKSNILMKINYFSSILLIQQRSVWVWQRFRTSLLSQLTFNDLIHTYHSFMQTFSVHNWALPN